jgi:hypothetical protein
MPDGIRFGVVRGISYGLFGKPDEFVPQARALGAGLIRAYVYWSQVEPRPGEYTWDVVDALLEQLDGAEEVWITVCSSSPWATAQPTDFLPPSPAHDIDTYQRFVHRLVRRCAGRVHYWQCDNEPSNAGLLWAGTAEAYVRQLRAMRHAVSDADPRAAVVLGGCGYDVLSSEPGSEPRRFFDHLLTEGRDCFDVFDVHLYGEPTLLPGYIRDVRAMMRAHGYQKPVLAGEYNGPSTFEFPEVEEALQRMLVSAFTEAPTTQSSDELAARAEQETPERRAMAALYDRVADLPPKLQMFMAGCPAELEEKRHRIACRGIVMRNLFALAEDVPRTVCWNLAPEIPGYRDPLQIMGLMFGKFALLDYDEGSALTRRSPAADTFALLTEQLHGVRTVRPVEIPEHPGVRTFEVEFADREPTLVAWDQRDQFDGEDEPPVPVSLPWLQRGASAIDAFGDPQPVEVADGVLHIALSVTPVFIGGRS